MTSSKEPKSSDLEVRITHLEEQNRWYMYAMETLVSMSDMHGEAKINRDPLKIFHITCQYLKRFIDFSLFAFYLVNEEDNSFKLLDVSPSGKTRLVDQELDYQIDSGDFAWALNQNRPVFPKSSFSGKQVVLHSLSTKTRIRGMCIGVLAEGQERTYPANYFLSAVLHHAAHGLEGVELYRILQEHANTLEKLVQAKNRELEYQHHHDILTGLPNRASCLYKLGNSLSRHKQDKGQIVIMLCDIDKFKRINDTLGYKVGDEALKDVTQRLLECRHPQYSSQAEKQSLLDLSLFRVSGDEFCLQFTNVQDMEEIAETVRRLFNALNRPVLALGHAIIITMSIGIAVFPGDAADSESMLKNAGIAMSNAKQAGHNEYRFFQPEMNVLISNYLTIENDLRRGLAHNEFTLFYQPKVQSSTGHLAGFEALIRWIHPEKGLVPPNDFIPIAEETGLIIPLGYWIIEEACQQICLWREKGLNVVPVSINISPIQLKEDVFFNKLREIIIKTGVDPALLGIEITETTVMHDVESNALNMARLRELNIEVSIDDFGTGYSSLSYLKKLPIDVLKIDRSFVSDMATDPDAVAVVDAIISIAHTLKLSVVAEGVETREQLKHLRDSGCEYIQGFLCSRPVPGSMAAGFMGDVLIEFL
jgi:diguanylate cyclase (GGDEF)-like protein